MRPAGAAEPQFMARVSEPRYDDACDEAGQCNAYQREGTAEKVGLAEGKNGGEHNKSDDQQKRRTEKQFVMGYRQEAIDQSKKDREHAMCRIKSDPASPHRCLFRN